MKTVLLTRAQYDFLVTKRSSWMALRWNSYQRQWSIGGVQVTGRPYEIQNLLAQLESVPADAKANVPANLARYS